MSSRLTDLPTNLQNLISQCRMSNFNFPAEKTNININSREKFIKGLYLWCDYTNYENDNYISTEDFFKKIIPEFQRNNDKWNTKMKISFVENLLKGCDTFISLYKFDKVFKSHNDISNSSETINHSDDCFVLDGFQRLTAIFDFLDNKIKVFGLSYDEIKEALPIFNTRLYLKIYTFDNIENVGRFYVEMNENITHSSEDILKAKDYFKSQFNIEI